MSETATTVFGAIGGAFVVVVGALVIEIITAVRQQKLQRQSLGVKAMSALWQSREFRDDVSKVMKIPDEEIAGYAKQSDKEYYNLIVRTINYFEVIGAGVNAGIYDKGIIKRLMASQTIRVFDKVSPFIEALREQEPKCKEGGKEFQEFAERLEKEK